MSESVKIAEGQEFKLQIKLVSTIVRDEFYGIGPAEFKKLFGFAVRITDCYKGSKIILLIKSKATHSHK